MRRVVRLLAVLAGLTSLAFNAPRAAAQQAASADAQLAQAKAALARYQDPVAAVFDG